jgi:hypothetical protein
LKKLAELNRILDVLNDRKARAEDESVGGALPHLVGKRRRVPLISMSRARTLGKILWLIGDLDSEHLESVERVADLAYADQYGRPAEPGLSSAPKREVDELAAIVRALSFDSDDSVMYQPVEAAG